MNITPVNCNINQNKNNQSFGMEISSGAKKQLKRYAEEGIISRKLMKALKELGETKQERYELTNIDIECAVHEGYVSSLNILGSFPTKIQIEDKKRNSDVSIEHFFLGSALKTIRRLKDDNFVRTQMAIGRLNKRIKSKAKAARNAEIDSL